MAATLYEMSAAPSIVSGMTASSMPGLPRLAGVATAAELMATGMSRGQLRRLVQRGAWLRLAHGVFAPAGLVAAAAGDAAGKHAVRVAAVLALTGPGAVASHHGAALIHGMDVLGRHQVARPGDGQDQNRVPAWLGSLGQHGIR